MAVVTLTRMPLDALVLAPYNPRKMPEVELERLKNSIKAYGLVRPLVVNKRNNHIVGGNQTYLALKSLKEKDTDVALVDLNDADEKALNLALNKISGDWDLAKLSDVMQDLNREKVMLSGFSDDEYVRLVSSVPLSKDLVQDLELGQGLELKAFTEESNIPGASTSKLKNANYFVLEYYDNDELFKEVQTLLTQMEAFIPPHNIDGKKFAEVLRNARR